MSGNDELCQWVSGALQLSVTDTYFEIFRPFKP